MERVRTACRPFVGGMPQRWREQVRGVMSNFAATTTLHGVPKLYTSKSPIVKFIWITVCIYAFVMFGSLTLLVLARYFAYPKKVTVDLVSGPVPFPSVTLCNMRVLDVDILNTINRKFLQDHNAASHVNTSMSEFILHYMAVTDKYGPLRYLTIYDREFQEAFSRAGYSANIPQHIISAAGIQLDEFIVSCHFREHQCNRSEDFNQFFNSHYFNCFTYNGGHVIDGVLSGGTENGWSSVLYSGSGMLDKNDEINHLPGLSVTSNQFSANDGVRVVIHPPGTTPFPMFEGFDVPPGFSVSFGVRPRKIKRMKEPHGNCTDKNPFYKDEPGDGSSYRLISCQKMCLQRFIIDSCGCKAIQLPDIPGSNVSSCQHMRASNACKGWFFGLCWLKGFFSQVKCMQGIIDKVIEDPSLNNNCSCFPPCDEIHYDVSYSLSKWPASGFIGDSAAMDVLSDLQLSTGHRDADWHAKTASYFNFSNREEFLKDFVRLSVYIADTNMLVTQELEDYPSFQMASDIGGQLGLWVGFSLITLVEVIELVCHLCWMACNYIKNERNKSPDNVELEDETLKKEEEVTAALTDGHAEDADHDMAALLAQMTAMAQRHVAQNEAMEEKLLTQNEAMEEKLLEQNKAAEDRYLAQIKAMDLLEGKLLAENVAMGQKRVAQQVKHQAENRGVQEEHAAHIKAMEEKYMTQIKTLEDRNTAQSKDMEDRHMARYQAMEQVLTARNKTLEDKLLTQIKTLEQRHEDQVKAMEEKFMAQTKAMA